MKQLVPIAWTPQDWAPLAEFASVDQFERVGTFLEIHESVGTVNRRVRDIVKRISELPERVYFEIEERHIRNQRAHELDDGVFATSPFICSSHGDATPAGTALGTGYFGEQCTIAPNPAQRTTAGARMLRLTLHHDQQCPPTGKTYAPTCAALT